MTETPVVDIISAIKDPLLIGDVISPHQEVALRTLYGLPLQTEKITTRVLRMETCRRCKGSGRLRGAGCRYCYTTGKAPFFRRITETPLQLYKRATTRSLYRPKEYLEAGIYPGARSGKSDKFASNIAIYEATLRKHRLSRGERGYIPVIAVDKKQASVVHTYIKDKLLASPALSQMIVNVTREEIELDNRITIAILPCIFRQLRGWSIPCAILDEVAVWRDEETLQNPAKEIIRAVRRGMATFPNAKLVKISSPFAKAGVVWEEWNGREDLPNTFLWKLPSWEMSPVIEEEWLIAEYLRDSENFEREFAAQFWEAANALLPPERIDLCISRGVQHRLPDKDYDYMAIVDVAFKSDEFAFCVLHKDPAGKVVFDHLRSWQGHRKNPVKMKETLLEIAGTLKTYGMRSVYGDQFCAEPVRQTLREMGVEFHLVTTTSNTKQAMYSTTRALIMSDGIDLLDNDVANAQLKSLSLSVNATGAVKITVPSGQKKDLATVIATGCYLSTEKRNTAYQWIRAYSEIGRAAQSHRLTLPGKGATMCVDCGKTMADGENYYGIGAGTGQCLPCREDHGTPTYGATKPKELRPRLIDMKGLGV